MVDPFDLNLRHLFGISEIDRAGSITAACNVANLSQSALTQGLANLEALVGSALFDRQNAGVTATVTGRLLIERVERASALLKEGGRPFRRLASTAIERRASMAQLRALVGIGASGGFAVAARTTGVSQPGLHRAARELEQIVGQSLFVRVGRTIQLTQAAMHLLHFTQLALAELRSGLAEIEEVLNEGAGRVVIGAMPLARATLVPRVLDEFYQLHRSATVGVIDGPYEELLLGLRHGEIDLLLGALRDPLPENDIVQLPLFENQVVVICRHDHPLVGTTDLDCASLSVYPWVISKRGTPLRKCWETLFLSQGFKVPSVNVECSSVMTIRGLLLEGNWLTLLSRAQVRAEKQAGMIVELGQPFLNTRRSIGMTTRKNWRMTKAQETIMDLIKKAALHENE